MLLCRGATRSAREPGEVRAGRPYLSFGTHNGADRRPLGESGLCVTLTAVGGSTRDIGDVARASATSRYSRSRASRTRLEAMLIPFVDHQRAVADLQSSIVFWSSRFMRWFGS